jgi:hypothetical protein
LLEQLVDITNAIIEVWPSFSIGEQSLGLFHLFFRGEVGRRFAIERQSLFRKNGFWQREEQTLFRSI